MAIDDYESEEDRSFWNPIDFEKESRYLDIEQTRNEDRTRALKGKQREYERNQDFLEQQGIDYAEPEGKSGLWWALDMLDSGRQSVAGVIGKATGREGYSDLGYWDAAAKGREEDLTTADMLRDQEWFKDKPIITAMTGFAGDVVTDPMNWFTLGTGTATKIGGRSVSDAKLLTKEFGEQTPFEISQRLYGIHYNEAADLLRAEKAPLIEAGLMNEQEFGDMISSRANVMAQNKMYGAFSDIRNFIDKKRKYQTSGAADLAVDEVTKDVQDTATKYAAALGLADPADLDKVFKPGSIRFSSPVSGSPMFEQIPVLNAKEADIPIVSDLTANISERIGDFYYNGVKKVDDYLANAFATDSGSVLPWVASNARKFLTKGNEKMTNAASLLSRRIQASGEITGSRAKLNTLTEHERALELLTGWQAEEAAFGARNVLKHPQAQAMFNDGFKALEQSFSSADPVQGFSAAMKGVADKYNAATPGSGDDLVRFITYADKEFKRLGQGDMDSGFIKETLNGYLPHIYEPIDKSLKDPNGIGYRKLQKLFNSNTGGTDFSLKRVIQTSKEAKALGYQMNTNLFDVLFARKYWSARIREEKSFAEQLALRYSMPEDVYSKVHELATGSSKEKAYQAAKVLAKFDVGLDPAKVGGIVMKVPGRDNPVTPELYGHWREILDNPNDPMHDMVKEYSDTLGLKWTPEEEMQVGAQWEAYQRVNGGKLGRAGETTFARAGATTISDLAQRKIVRGLSEDDSKFWKGALPRSLVEAVHESVAIHDVLTRQLGNAKDPTEKAMKGFLGLFGAANRIQKAATTVIWPAYWTRNITSAPVQGLESASSLGMALNPMAIWDNSLVMSGKKGFTTLAGEKLTAAQAATELASANIHYSSSGSQELIAAMGDMMLHVADSPSVMRTVPELKGYMQREGFTDSALGKMAKRWAENKKGIPGLPYAAQGIKTVDDARRSLFGAMEAHGRAHTYLNLRKNGYSAVDAANETNRLLVDYLHGKTKFETDVMNNVFFFYAFSRGQLANNFIGMMRRPGIATTQLSASRNIAELLRGPDFEEPAQEDLDLIQSTRSQEGFSHYVGENPRTGLPRMVTGTGLPIEESLKWMSFRKPKDNRWNSWVNSAFDSVARSAQLTAAQLNPWLKAPLETLVTKKNFYFDRPITDRQMRTIPTWERDINIMLGYPMDKVPKQIWETMDKATTAVLDGTDNGDGTMTVNPYRYAVLLTVVPGASRFIDTRKALSEPGVSASDKYTRLLSGIRVDEMDPEASAVYDRLAKQKEFMSSVGIPTNKRDRAIMLEHQQSEEEDDEDAY